METNDVEPLSNTRILREVLRIMRTYGSNDEALYEDLHKLANEIEEEHAKQVIIKMLAFELTNKI